MKAFCLFLLVLAAACPRLLLAQSEFAGATNAPWAATNAAPVTSPDAAPGPVTTTHVASLGVADLREFEAQSTAVQHLISDALKLTTQNLGYKYGSSDPANGGMDCSGTVYYLLRDTGLKDVPRDASGMYKWVWQKSRFQAVTSSSPDTFELGLLQPGDLLFWTGTYDVKRDPPVTHVMIYLGINRHTNRRVMIGASEGRRFNDQSMYGVSVFDFTLPRVKAGETSTSRFIGYGAIPGLDAAAAAKAP
jgi:cell wall-associated NlpC family hydrolase